MIQQSGADPGFRERGAGHHGERVGREPIRSLGAEPPVGSRSKALGGVKERTPEADSIFVKYN